jgi:Rad3-related DNA helicase
MTENIVVPDKPMFNNFPEWRKYQQQAVDKIINTDKKFIILDAPTGSGKSLIGMSVAKLLGGRTYYLVGTKDLQDQIIRDFPFFALLKGRNNFDCLVKDVSCDECVYSYIKKPCPKYCECPYYTHKGTAKQSNFVVWNYPMFLVNQTFIGDFDAADLIICDEAHLLEGALMNFINITFDHEFFNELSLTFPGKDEEKYVFDRVNEAEKIANKMYCTISGQLQMKIFENEEPSRIDIHKCCELESKLKKIKFFKRVYNSDTWVMEYRKNQYDWQNDYVSFKPIKVDCFSSYIFNWGKKVLLVSATMPYTPVVCSSLGINKNDIARLNIPSTFKRENRAVIYKPIGRMSYAYWEETIQKIIKFLVEYCNVHKEKVLIHCVNYKILKALMNSNDLIFNDYSIFSHETSEERSYSLEKFKESKSPSMLITPSMETGIDLPGDLCRVQFILKVPYPSLVDKQVKERLAIDRDWYISSTINRLVQASGRIVRSEDDWGKTYILDECFADLVRHYKKFFPSWYLESIAVERRST